MTLRQIRWAMLSYQQLTCICEGCKLMRLLADELKTHIHRRAEHHPIPTATARGRRRGSFLI